MFLKYLDDVADAATRVDGVDVGGGGLGVCDELQNVTQKCVEVTLEPQRPQGLNHDDVAMSDSDANLTGHRTSSLN